MNELSEILALATRSIEAGYILLPIADGDPVYRERVYCYELYHQMRRLWPRPCQYVLNGDVDKAGHVLLRQWGADGCKPDLLVHSPGNMARNHAVIEIKGPQLSAAGMRKDIRTMSLFADGVGYERAIYLIYGPVPEHAFIEELRAVAGQVQSTAQIELWMHAASGMSARSVTTLRG